jgi:RHS repeat-associated protein
MPSSNQCLRAVGRAGLLLCVLAAAGGARATTIDAPATSESGTFTVAWPAGYELRLADVGARIAAAPAVSASFTGLPPGAYRFVLASCAWSYTGELGALYSCSPVPASARTVTVTGAAPRPLDELTDAAGTTAYLAGVGRRAAAEIAVPIRVPEGVRGVALDVALAYDSARAGDRPRHVVDDVLGYGWWLRGIPYLHRCRAGQAVDANRNGLPLLDGGDLLCLDGEPLALVAGSHWSAGAEYRKAADPDLRVTLRETTGIGRWFEVRYPDGAVARFGDTAESQVQASGQASNASAAPGPGGTLSWGLRKLTGALGDELTVAWRKFDGYGHLQPDAISYAGAEVRFVYGPRLDLAPVALTAQIAVRRLAVLQGIEVRVQGRLVRDYRLANRIDGGGRLRLEAIQECGYDSSGSTASCLVPLRIVWTDVSPSLLGHPIAVAELRDGLGARTGYDYVRVGPATNSLVYPESPYGALTPVPDTLPADLSAVAEFRTSDGLSTNGMRRWTYRYRGLPHLSNRSRGYLGVPEVRITDRQSGVVTYAQSRLDWPFAGEISQVRAFDAPYNSHTLELAREEHAFAQKLHTNGTRTVYPVRHTRWTLEGAATIGATIATVTKCFRPMSGDACPTSGSEGDATTQNRTVTVDGAAITDPAFTPAFWGDVPVRSITATGLRRTVTEVATLVNVGLPWIRNATTRRTVTHAVPGQASRTVREDITLRAGTRLPARTTRFPGDPRLEVTTTRSFETVAGTATTRVTLQGVDTTAREWTYATPDLGGPLAAAVTDPLGRERERTIDDRFGLAASVTDSDGRTATTDYDPFGRVARETAADGGTVTYDYERCDAADCSGVSAAVPAMRVTRSVRHGATQTAPTRVTYLDVLGRTVLEETEALESGQGWTRSRTVYDDRNRVRYRSRPVLGVAAPTCDGPGTDCTWYGYDVRDRVVRTDRPDGGATTVTYVGTPGKRTLTETELVKAQGQSMGSRTRRVVQDSLGLVVQSIDAADSPAAVTTTYGYDAQGHLASVAAGGVTVATLEYDLAGNRTRIVDVSRGTTDFAFNAFGELVQSSKPDGDVTTYDYDALGRLLRRREPGGIEHTWTWDPPHGTGQLATRARPGFSETYGYDSAHGRLTSIATTIDVPGIWSTSRTRELDYDAAGRLASQRYPNGQSVSYGYSTTGHPVRVTSAGGVVLRDLRANDAFGNPTDERFNDDALRTRRSFEPGAGRLTRIETGTASAPRAIQDLETVWRTSGALHRRIDRRDTTATADDLFDAFTYDAIQRLTRQTTSGAATRVLDFAYAPNGTLTAKRSSVAGDLSVDNFVYGGAAEPYRLARANVAGVETSLDYDANGNTVGYRALGEAATELRFDARNNVTRITAGLEGASFAARDEFWYDTDDRRFLGRETWYDNGSERVRRVLMLGGDYEEVRAPAGATWDVVQRIQLTPVVRQVRRRNAATQTWQVVHEYAHRDHLGSIDAVTDASGAVLQRTSFDPFGGRRTPNRSRDLSQAELDDLLAAQDVRGARGFTDHEHRDRTGFVHMNGRVYDPRLARFVSPDPLVQRAGFGQAFNRYAYVFNDPASASDPSGYCRAREGYQLNMCDIDTVWVRGERGSGSWYVLDPEGGNLWDGLWTIGGGGGVPSLPWLDELLAAIGDYLAEPPDQSEESGEEPEVIVISAPRDPAAKHDGANSLSEVLAQLDEWGINALSGSLCLGTVLGGCGSFGIQTADGKFSVTWLIGVVGGVGGSLGVEHSLFASEAQSSSGFGTAVKVSGGMEGIGGSMVMTQGTDGVNVSGAVGFGFGFGGGVGFYYTTSW